MSLSSPVKSMQTQLSINIHRGTSWVPLEATNRCHKLPKKPLKHLECQLFHLPESRCLLMASSSRHHHPALYCDLAYRFNPSDMLYNIVACHPARIGASSQSVQMVQFCLYCLLVAINTTIVALNYQQLHN